MHVDFYITKGTLILYFAWHLGCAWAWHNVHTLCKSSLATNITLEEWRCCESIINFYKLNSQAASDLHEHLLYLCSPRKSGEKPLRIKHLKRSLMWCPKWALKLFILLSSLNRLEILNIFFILCREMCLSAQLCTLLIFVSFISLLPLFNTIA